MKGLKKCCGLLCLSLITLGLSLSVCSNVNALKYKVSTIDLGTSTFPPSGGGVVVNTGITYDSSLFSSDPYSVYENYFFSSSSYDRVNNSYACQYGGNYYNSFRKSGSAGSSVKHLYSTFSYSLPYGSYTNSNRCDYLKPYSNDVNLAYYFNSGSLPVYALGTPNLGVNLPYFFNVSGFYINADLKVDNGLVNKTKIDFADVYGHAPYNISGFDINFGTDFEQVVGYLPSGMSIEINGSFMFDSDNPESDVFTLEGFSPYYRLTIADSINHDYIPCDLSVIDNRSNSHEYPWELSYSCHGFLSHSYNNGLYYLALSFSSGGGVLWSYPATHMIYQGSYLITDGVDTLVPVEYGHSPVGNGVSDSPGYPSTNSSTTETDWFSSLTNMFNFSFYNPFAPLFSMFLQPEDCVSIPIVAGMINSTESTYCSWWPASVRNVLTPVFGLSSIMILFGFVVRWLGSSSGNMFEDQTSHKWVNTQFKSKGVK